MDGSDTPQNRSSALPPPPTSAVWLPEASAPKLGTLRGSSMSQNEDDNVPQPIEDEKTSRSDPSALPVSDSQIAEVEVHSDSQLVVESIASILEPSPVAEATPAGKKAAEHGRLVGSAEG